MEPLNSRNGSPSSKTLLWTAHFCQKTERHWEEALLPATERHPLCTRCVPAGPAPGGTHTSPRVTRRAGGTGNAQGDSPSSIETCGFMPQFLGFTPGPGTGSTLVAFSPQFSSFGFFPRSRLGDKKNQFLTASKRPQSCFKCCSTSHLEMWGEVFKMGNNLNKVVVGVIRSWSGSNPPPTPLLQSCEQQLRSPCFGQPTSLNPATYSVQGTSNIYMNSRDFKPHAIFKSRDILHQQMNTG